MNLKKLKAFINEVERKFGEKADEFRIELHIPEAIGDDCITIPYEVGTVGVAKYPKDKDHKAELVIAITRG